MKLLFLFSISVSLLTAQSFRSVVQRLEQSPVEQRQRIIEQYLNTKRISPIIEEDSLVHFVLYGEADSVSMNSDLQHWLKPEPLTKIPCGQYSFFYASFTVPPDARLDYTLTIDGKDRTDPQNPNITPSGFGPHSEVRMPKFIPSPYLVQRPEIAHGTIDSLAPFMKIPTPLSKYMISPRSIKIYRPAGYDTLQHLPVVYVHDGFEMIDYAYMPRILDNLIAEGRIAPVIAVFIPPVERGPEYYDTRVDQFVQYLTNEIVPLIDHLYRTDPVPQKRAMIGISAGGHISLYAALKRPDMFMNVGGQSSGTTPRLIALTGRQARGEHLPPQMKIYLDCGRYDLKFGDPLGGIYDLLEVNRAYSAQLSELRIPHYFKELNDGHQWASWRERLPEMLVYFFGRP
jgi:enterochelin esterase family protein